MSSIANAVSGIVDPGASSSPLSNPSTDPATSAQSTTPPNPQVTVDNAPQAPPAPPATVVGPGVPAGSDVQAQEQRAIAQTNNPSGSSSTPPAGVGSVWKNLVAGALSGLQGISDKGRPGFASGLGSGARAGAAAAQQATENKIAQQKLQFESVQAADAHIKALDDHNFHEQQSDEMKLETSAKAQAFHQFLMDQYGFDPNVSANDSSTDAQAAQQTLANANGGKVPNVAVVHEPAPDGQHGTINIYAPTQAQAAQNRTGFIKQINDARAAQGLPALDPAVANSMSYKELRDQSVAAVDAMNPTAPPADPKNIQVDLAAAQQKLDAYKKHADATGQPDANPAVTKMLQARVDYLNALPTETKPQTPQEAATLKHTELENKKLSNDLATATGSNLTGPAFLASLPQQRASAVRAIGEGRMELTPTMLRSKDGQALAQQVTSAYPDFDQSKAQSYFKTRQDFTSGKTSTGINSYNTAIAHLGTMYDHVSGTNSLQLNNPASDVHRQLDLDKQLVSTELTKAVSNGQMTEGEKNSILGSISGYTVSSYQTRIKEAATLLNGKLESYQQQWNNGAPPGAVSQVRILSPQSEATIAHINGTSVRPGSAPQSGVTPPTPTQNDPAGIR